MSYENIQLVAGGSLFEGWERVSVRAGVNEAVRSFDIEVSEVSAAFGLSPFSVWNFPPNTPITLLASGTLMVTGYVDDYNPSGDAESHKVQVTGRGRGMDYVDCGCVHPTGRFENKTVDKIGQELDKFGVGVSIDVAPGPPVPWFQIRQGSTPHAEMMRLLAQRRMTMKGEADGSITITRGGQKRHAGGLIQGDNIKAMSATLSARERFSDYIVKGQSSLGTTRAQLRPRGEARDPNVPRYRPKVIIDQAETDPRRIQERADWEALRAAGFSAKAQITTVGFRDRAGSLWEPGHLVFVMSGWLKLEQDMLIESVQFQQDDQAGTTAQLALVDPKAYAAGGSSRSGSGDVWSMP